MKSKPILAGAIIISLIVEIIIMILVFNEIGSERLPKQLARLTLQLILITFIFSKESKAALFGLVGFHIFSALFHFSAIHNSGIIGWVFLIFHFTIGVVIYFHDWFEEKLKIKKV